MVISWAHQGGRVERPTRSRDDHTDDDHANCPIDGHAADDRAGHFIDGHAGRGFTLPECRTDRVVVVSVVGLVTVVLGRAGADG